MIFIHSVGGHMDIGIWLCYKNSHKNQHSMYFKIDEPSRSDKVCSVLTNLLKLSSQTLGSAEVPQSHFQTSCSITRMSATCQRVCNPQ